MTPHVACGFLFGASIPAAVAIRCRAALTLILLGAGIAAGLRGATLDEVAGSPESWPREVKVTSATRAVQVRNGKPAGAVLLGAGRILLVTGISKDGVLGRAGADTFLVPVERTDLLQNVHVPGSAKTEPPQAGAAGLGLPKAALSGVMQRRLGEKLVRLDDGILKPAGEQALRGVRYYGLYFSASWCGPCRQFTPRLIAEYRRIKAEHPEFEIVFVSADRSSGAMRDYMKDDGMPWLALRYEAIRSEPEIMRYAGPGIPCLVLVDSAGRVLSDSFDGDNYLGPGHVLDDAVRILGNGS